MREISIEVHSRVNLSKTKNQGEPVTIRFRFKSIPGDSRRCVLTLETQARKASVSLHPFVWKLDRYWREFRLTVLGLNLHYRAF